MILLAGLPEAPQYLTVQPGYDKVLLSWDAPKNDGGFRIEGYCVMMKVSNSNWCQLAWVKEENRHYTVENLQQSKPYRFCVIAENVIGRGPYVEINSDVYLKSLAGTFIISILFGLFKDYFENCMFC